MNRLLTALGFLCVTLGVVGIFLPVLPTTPFLLLASWLFLKSNPRWRTWLLSHPRLGPYIRNYVIHRAIPMRTKLATIAALWLSIIISVCLISPLWLKILLLLIASAVTAHILLLKTLRS